MLSKVGASELDAPFLSGSAAVVSASVLGGGSSGSYTMCSISSRYHKEHQNAYLPLLQLFVRPIPSTAAPNKRDRPPTCPPKSKCLLETRQTGFLLRQGTSKCLLASAMVHGSTLPDWTSTGVAQIPTGSISSHHDKEHQNAYFDHTRSSSTSTTPGESSAFIAPP